MIADTLRFPEPAPSAGAYKDWLHLNLFEPATGMVGLLNVSLHGSPWDPRSRAVGTALLHVPGIGWVGNLEVSDLSRARLGVSSLALERVALSVGHADGLLLASASLPDDGLALGVAARMMAPPIRVEQRMPFGPGWISWHAVPRLSVEGYARIGDRELDLGSSSAYHDHNWGRWHWGEDVGWEWAVLLAPAPGPAFVAARITDRTHRHAGAAMLTVDFGARRRTFLGPAVAWEHGGAPLPVLRRLPGALAALFGDRAAPRLPSWSVIRAGDGSNHVEIHFRARAAAQLIAGDPMVPGYGFLHETVGEFTAAGRIGSADFQAAGLAVLEHVD